jgi:putative membrane protein
MRLHLAAVSALLATLMLVACGAPDTRAFVREAAFYDMYEVEAGQLAAARGQSEAVKQFARQMVEAHTQFTAELKGVVDAEKIDITLPSQPDEKHRRMLEDLSAAHQDDFDKTYAKQQVKAHEEAVESFARYAESGADEVVKAFAAKVLPVLKQQLDAARTLPR